MINSDDPAYFGGYLNRTLMETAKALDLSREQIQTLVIHSFQASFLPESEKELWISKVRELPCDGFH